MSYSLILPFEILPNIIKNLPVESLCRFASVSKKFKELCETSSVWEEICFNYKIPGRAPPLDPSKKSFFYPYKDHRPTEEEMASYKVQLDDYNEWCKNCWENRGAMKFTLQDYNSFRKRFLIICFPRNDGTLWCHYCGPRLITHLNGEQEITMCHSRLHRIRQSDHVLICEECFNNRFGAQNLAVECFHLAKLVRKQLQDYGLAKFMGKNQKVIKYLKSFTKLLSSIKSYCPSDLQGKSFGGHYVSNKARKLTEWEPLRWREAYHWLIKSHWALQQSGYNSKSAYLWDRLALCSNQIRMLPDVVESDLGSPAIYSASFLEVIKYKNR